MSLVYTNGKLDLKSLLRPQVQQNFNDITNFVNVAKFDGSCFGHRSVNERNTGQPISVDLASKFGYGAPVVLSGPHAGTIYNWYLINGSTITYNLPDSGMDNIYEGNKNVIQLEAFVRNMGPFTNPTNITHATIGYSTNAGVTWNPLEAHMRAFNYSSLTNTPGYLPAGLHPHYIFDTASWYSPTLPVNNGVMLIATAGGIPRDVASNISTMYGVLVNGNTQGDSYIKGQLFGTARTTL